MWIWFIDDPKVRDHCHITGKYRGAAHSKCNLKMRTPKFVPILFHNLEGYDSHLFIKSLGFTEGKIDCIPKTDEKYISFTKKIVMENKDGKEVCLELRFLDSFKFTLKSLDKLSNTLKSFPNLESEMGKNPLLKKKGIFPYDYFDSFERLSETKIPAKSKFYSKLYEKNISEEEYRHAKMVWNAFECKTFRDYHNLYLNHSS